jgi:hypothetical protein
MNLQSNIMPVMIMKSNYKDVVQFKKWNYCAIISIWKKFAKKKKKMQLFDL